MINWILKKIGGSKNQREIKRMRPAVDLINKFDEEFKILSDDQLRAKTAQWKAELSAIEDPVALQQRLDEILPEAFALVKNVARRLVGQTISVCDHPIEWNMVHFDVQL